MPSASHFTRALMSLLMKMVRSPCSCRRCATPRMRLSAESRSSAKGVVRSQRSMRMQPPCSFHTTPSNSRPIERSLSSARMVVRAFRPVSSLFFLNWSSSSITCSGMITSCSSNLYSEFGLCSSTFVSSTKCLRVAEAPAPASCCFSWCEPDSDGDRCAAFGACFKALTPVKAAYQTKDPIIHDRLVRPRNDRFWDSPCQVHASFMEGKMFRD